MKFKIYFEGITEIGEEESLDMWGTVDPIKTAKGETEHIAAEMGGNYSYITNQKVKVEPITD
jgi:hypothetical protein